MQVTPRFKTRNVQELNEIGRFFTICTASTPCKLSVPCKSHGINAVQTVTVQVDAVHGDLLSVMACKLHGINAVQNVACHFLCKTHGIDAVQNVVVSSALQNARH
jgi:hypothetical protein